MIRDFEDYIEKANLAASEEELFDLYVSAVSRHGLDRALFCIATEHQDIQKMPGIGVIHNYPGDWMQYYFENHFDSIDPVMIYGLSQIGSYTWDIIPSQMPLMKKQVQCLNYGREAGLHNGICTPLRGINNQLAGLSLASSEAVDSFDGKLDLITAYSNHFYITWKKFHLKMSETSDTPNYALTEKERDVLSWVSQGKSDTDIAAILNISEHTVDFHLRNIFRKLNANSRVLAVVKALSYGIICP